MAIVNGQYVNGAGADEMPVGQSSVPTPAPQPVATPPVTGILQPGGKVSAAGDPSSTDASGGPMPLINRLGVVMSMLQGNGTTGLSAGGVDTSITGLASENPIMFNNSDADTGNDTTGVTNGDTHPHASGPVTDNSAGAKLTSDNAANKALGQQMASKYGWDSGAEWTALNNVVMSESGWSSTVQNAKGTAAGIAQNIHGFSDSYQKGNAQQQIQWLLDYIKGRYGDPVAAWQHKLDTKGQYGNAGGWY